MKALGWYFTHAGRRIWAATKAEAARLAQAVADDTGLSVSVRPVKAKARPAAKTMKRNPLALGGAGGSPEMWRAEEHARRQRLDHLAATKARRLAKGLRGRGTVAKADEAAKRKSGKFLVTATNRREELKLYRPNRSQAQRLADEFIAAGYKVSLKEV